MRNLRVLAALVVVSAGMVVLSPGHSHATAVRVWVKLARGSRGTSHTQYEFGLFRTADGDLHVAYPFEGSGQKNGYRVATITPAGTVPSSVTALSGWSSLSAEPRVVMDGHPGFRLIFSGNQDNDSGNPYSIGAVYSLTSPHGDAWTLAGGSMSHRHEFNDGIAATVLDGTPVAAAAFNQTVYVHQGVDPDIPATVPDQELTGDAGTARQHVALSTNFDFSGTQMFAAWFQEFHAGRGFWAQRIAPTAGQPMQAPGSGGLNVQDNNPDQQVAIVTGGRYNGQYLAYCSPTASKPCAHVDLWKVGSSTHLVVPGTPGEGDPQHVALSRAPLGRLWVTWFDESTGIVHATRTNKAVTEFEPVQSVDLLSGWQDLFDLQGEGSKGALDTVVDILLRDGDYGMFDTQISPVLSLSASPDTVSHTRSTVVTFRVTDAGDPVAGATVKVVGRSATTNSNGVARITIPQGTSTGVHQAFADAHGYATATVAVHVT